MDQIEKNFKEKQKAGSDALFWIRLANDSYFSLRSILLGLATFILPLTASVVASSVLSELDTAGKILLVLGWLFLGISIVFGVIQHFDDSNFFAKFSHLNSWKEYVYKIFEDYPDVAKKYPKLVDRIIGSMPPPSEKSRETALKFQMFFIFSGIILIMIAAVRLLFG